MLRLALPALERAARQARKVASQTRTALVIMQDGRLQRIYPNEVPEADTKYHDEQDR
ncbi:MAG: hypothetical protein ACI909_003265 [Planctomycetota bacterium]